MVVYWPRAAVAATLFAVLLLFGFIGPAEAQGIRFTPYTAANELSRPNPSGGLDLAPSNPLGMPGSAYGVSAGSEIIPISSGMLGSYLPRIPNLEFGFLYSFGKNVRSGRFSADYVLPLDLSPSSVLFGEAHAEGWDFWKKASGGANNRVDLSLGGGYRRLFGDGLLVGANAFYDSSRLFNKWYSSGGFGLELAGTVGGSDAVDVNFNWYGNLFSRDGFVNAFRNKGGSFDLEAGYSHALLADSLDLRLKIVGYQFDTGRKVRGWRGGADITTRDGMFTLRYEHGHDSINRSYDTVGAFVNIGFQLENLLRGESPFTTPEPVFRSPRNLRRMLTQKVKRNWHQPAAVVLAKATPSPNGCSDERFVDVTSWRYDPRLAVGGPLFRLGEPPAACDEWLIEFPPQPHECLDPTQRIRVVLNYTSTASFDFNSNILVYVTDGSATNTTCGGLTCLSMNGFFGNRTIEVGTHAIEVYVDSFGTPVANQSAFTTTSTDPAQFLVGFYVPVGVSVSADAVVLNSVHIYFNQ